MDSSGLRLNFIVPFEGEPWNIIVNNELGIIIFEDLVSAVDIISNLIMLRREHEQWSVTPLHMMNSPGPDIISCLTSLGKESIGFFDRKSKCVKIGHFI